MLKQLKLKNFRRHTDLTVDFTSGLNVIRAANEGGKSTLAEAALYAMFGTKSLRDSFSETVTWGQPENSLKVELTVEFGGEVYTFTRSKGGAEVVRDGQVYVTGQTEVSTFAAKLIGADAKTAGNLMLANQNSLRGALEQGPKAAAELVEQLSDFDFFEHLLERMQERLALGSDVSARQRLDEANEKLETLSVEKIDTSAFESAIAKAPAFIAEIEAEISAKLKPTYEAASQVLDQAKNNRSTFDLLNNNLSKVQRMLDDAKAQKLAAEAKSTTVDTSPIKDLQALLDGAMDLVAQRKVYAAMGKLIDTYPEAFWEGDVESLQGEVTKTETEIESVNSQLADLSRQASDAQQQIKVLTAQLQKDDHCHACGQLLQNHVEIATKNLEREGQIEVQRQIVADADVRATPLKEQFAERKSELADLKGVFGFASPFDAFIRANAQYIEVNANFVPAKIQWKGLTPSSDSPDPSAIRQQISDIEEADKASRNAQARVEALTQTISDYEAQVKEFTQQLAGYDLQNVEAFQVAKDEAYQSLYNAEQTIERIKDEVREAQTQIQLAKQNYEQQQARVVEAQAVIAACKEEIDALAFNNALLKKVRAARPMVSDKLWNMVLSSVSTFFTQIRKVPSIVTKDKDGFKVNGQSVQSLSGSALDSLGMALRVALVKTFVPTSSFAIFDEPAAAADDDRAQSMIGFLQGAGFSQTILITHESDSEAVADNLITL